MLSMGNLNRKNDYGINYEPIACMQNLYRDIQT